MFCNVAAEGSRDVLVEVDGHCGSQHSGALCDAQTPHHILRHNRLLLTVVVTAHHHSDAAMTVAWALQVQVSALP